MAQWERAGGLAGWWDGGLSCSLAFSRLPRCLSIEGELAALGDARLSSRSVSSLSVLIWGSCFPVEVDW